MHLPYLYKENHSLSEWFQPVEKPGCCLMRNRVS